MTDSMDANDKQAFVDEKRRKRMAAIDRLPSDVRELVNEYGFNVVNSFMLCGITKPNQLRHLVETVLNEFSPTRGSFSAQGIRPELLAPKPTPSAMKPAQGTPA